MKDLSIRKFLSFTTVGVAGAFIGAPMFNCGKNGSCELFGKAS